MTTMRNLATVALAGLLAAPLSAQIVVRSDPSGTRSPRPRIEDGSDASSRSRADTRSEETRRASRKIPPGHLPPKGMCRVWIEGVAPGLQPPVTDCAAAERNRVANSRVIYGDRESFPGKGKGKLKKSERNRDDIRECSVRDGVVVDGRVVNVCRDERVRQDRRRSGRNDDDDNNDNDGDNEIDDDDNDRGRGDDRNRKVKLSKETQKNKGNRD